MIAAPGASASTAALVQGAKLHHRDVGAAKRLGDVLGALALLRGKLRPRAGRGSRLRLERGECIVGHDDAHQLPSAR